MAKRLDPIGVGLLAISFACASYAVTEGLNYLGIGWNSSTDFDSGRPLTENEIKLARKVYGDSIDYSSVYIATAPRNSDVNIAGEAWWNNIAMYFPFTCNDYGAEDCAKPIQGVFMHEMGHIYQLQNDLPMDHTRKYSYTLTANTNFRDLRTEQQAEVLEDYTLNFLKLDGEEGCKSPGIIGRLLGRDQIIRVVYDEFPAAKGYCQSFAPQ